MGIRINKMVGYGLINVTNDVFHSEFFDKLYDHELPDYFEWLETLPKDEHEIFFEAVMKKAYEKKPTFKYPDLPDSCFNMDKNVDKKDHLLSFCIRPLYHQNWYRYGDTLDHIEQSILGTDDYKIVSATQYLEVGIFPYNGFFVSTLTGESISIELMNTVNALLGILDDEIIISEYLSQIGFTTINQFKHCVKPKIPDEIVRICQYFDMFHSPSVVQSLRPMYMSWWS